MKTTPLIIGIMLIAAACTSTVGDTTTSVAAEPVASTVVADTTLVDNGLTNIVLTDVSELVKEVQQGVVTVSQNQTISRFGNLAEVPSGTGTGFVIDEDGHILTNFHVVQGATSLFITLPGGEERVASLVNGDPTLDMALLRVEDSTGLEPLRFGSSDVLEVGDPVVAIGNALGLGTRAADDATPTVSVGIVSAFRRNIAVGSAVLEAVVQTDAAINPGNSGGPLLNSEGEVVGINTAIAAQGQNIGFAIAISDARETIDNWLAGTGAPFLGVGVADGPDGVILQAIYPGTEADQAGLQVGDVVLGVDGDSINTAEQLIALIEQAGIGAQIDLQIQRGNQTGTVTVTIGER